MTALALELLDGRVLAWREFGAQGGWPVIAIHGSPDSSAVWALLDNAARRAGARIIAPDRPGFGNSSSKPDRSILDWVDDLDELTEHLELASFRLLAISGGSPYALAVAATHTVPVSRPSAEVSRCAARQRLRAGKLVGVQWVEDLRLFSRLEGVR